MMRSENLGGKLRIQQETKTQLYPGIFLISRTYVCMDESVFHAYAVTADHSVATVITGTANGGYGIDDCVDYVPGQMRTAQEEGYGVIAGINSGFFRRKLHCRPYGLSIRKGVEISPPYTQPYFSFPGGLELGHQWIGITGDGDILFGMDMDYLAYKDKLQFATSGSHILVQDGQICQTKYSQNRGPRSAFALTENKDIILLAVDGRQPGYSDGASSAEMAQVLLDLNAHVGVNLDGGGSTNLSIVKASGEIDTVNRPCENRKVFDTILLVKR